MRPRQGRHSSSACAVDLEGYHLASEAASFSPVDPHRRLRILDSMARQAIAQQPPPESAFAPPQTSCLIRRLSPDCT